MTSEGSNRPEGEKQQSAAQEWGDILRQIETQIRRDAARVAGVEEGSDWSRIGRGVSDSTRRSIARSVGLDEGASWDAIGQEVERTARGGVADVVGASKESDWPTIGRSIEERVRTFFDNLFEHGKTESVDKNEPPVDPWKK